MIAFALWALIGFLAPAYAAPPTASADDLPHNSEVTFSDPEGPLVRLLGFEVDRDDVRPGETYDVTLGWQTIRPAGSHYVIFVHLIDEAGGVVAQRDTYHGLGNYPSGYWRPNHTFVETYPVTLAETAYAPATLSLQVGMYSRDYIYRLETSNGSPDKSVDLGTVALNPLPGDFPNPQQVNFDDKIELLGYSMSTRSIYPGEKITFHFYWQIPQTPTESYRIFVHVIDDEGQIRANSDALPAEPMTDWPLNTPVEDERRFRIPKEVPPGFYQVEVGVRPERKQLERLPIKADDGHYLGYELLLSPIRVLPGE